MSLTIQCSQCSKTLEFLQTHIGKEVQCLNCNHVMTATGDQSSDAAAEAIPSEATSSEATSTSATVVMWQVRTPDGNKYGPISKVELDQWNAEGRLNEKCQVLQDGWAQWKSAADVYPEIKQSQPFNFTTASPQFQATPAEPTRTQSENPFSAPSITGINRDFEGESLEVPRSVVRVLQETKPWVLTLSVIGFLFSGLILILIILVLSDGGIRRLGIETYLIFGLMIYLGVNVTNAFFLLKYSNAISRITISNRTSSLLRALREQKNCWRFIAIIVLLIIAIYALIFFLVYLRWI